jgi:hypothetical protein
VSDVQAQGSMPQRSWLARFFGVIVELQTWKNLGYLVLAFPLGLFYFVFLVVGLAVGIALVIIWVGLPILAVTVLAWWAFAAFERWQATALLGVPIGGRPAPWEGDDSWWQRVKRHLGDARTWKDLAFLFVKFPLGIVSLVIVTVAVAVPGAFIGAPFYYRYVTWTTDNVERYGINLGTWRVNTLAEALVLVPIGIVALFALLHLVNLFARFSGVLAGALLDEGGPAPRPAAPAAPMPPSTPVDVTPQAPSDAPAAASPAAMAAAPVSGAPVETPEHASPVAASAAVEAILPTASPGAHVDATSLPGLATSGPTAPIDTTSPVAPVTQDAPLPVAPGPPPVAPGPPPVAPGPPPSAAPRTTPRQAPEPPARPQSGAPEATH